MTHNVFQTMYLNSTPTDTYTPKTADVAYCKKNADKTHTLPNTLQSLDNQCHVILTPFEVEVTVGKNLMLSSANYNWLESAK